MRWYGSLEMMELNNVWSINIGEMKRSNTLTREAAREKSRRTESSLSTSAYEKRSVG